MRLSIPALPRPLALLGINEEHGAMVKRLFSSQAKSQRGLYALAIGAMVLVAATTAMTAFLMEFVVNAMTQYEDRRMVLGVALAVAATFMVKGGANYVQTVSLSKAGNRIIANQQEDIYRKLLTNGVSFFTLQESSNLITRLSNGASAAQQVIEVFVTSLSKDLLMLLGLVGVMVYQAPTLSVFALIIGPAAVWGVRGLLRRVHDIMRSESSSAAEITRVLQETSKGIQVVKVFALEGHMQDRMGSAVRAVERRRNAMARIGAMTSPMMETLSGFAIAAIVAVSAFSFLGSEPTTPGQLMSFITAFMMAYEPAKRLSRVRVQLEMSMARLGLMFELLDYDEHLVEATDARDLEPGPGEVRFEGVNFAYKKNRLVLDGIDLTFAPKRMTALVGPSGGGKSTIFNLILRLYDPKKGRVAIDGQDLKDATFASLRNRISYVGQDTFLFSTSIRENIRCSRPDATDEEVEAAATAANAHEFIGELDDGYDTEVGENGVFLSGGQRQRIAIARAVLRRAEILLLDEATSALDATSEALVKDALARLREDVTTIVIAHRLATILQADTVHVVENGRIAESGSVEELLQNDGPFRGLYDKQFASAAVTA